MNLTDEDLYRMFNFACKTVGAPGYTGTLVQQSMTTRLAWKAFHATLQGHLDANMTVPASLVLLTQRRLDDEIRRFCDHHNKETLQALYNHMNALGIRVKR